MRRALTLFSAAGLLALGVCGGAMAQPGAHSSAAARSAVQATGAEFHITLSRGKVAPSKLRLEFVNFGEDDHDLAVQRVGSTATHYFGVVHPGDRSVERFRVRKGTYKLWCTLSDHRARGMSATLRVKKKS
jgi:plastocyanin